MRSHLRNLSVVVAFALLIWSIMSLRMSLHVSGLLVRLELHLMMPGPYSILVLNREVYKSEWSLSFGNFVTCVVVMCCVSDLGISM